MCPQPHHLTLPPANPAPMHPPAANCASCRCAARRSRAGRSPASRTSQIPLCFRGICGVGDRRTAMWPSTLPTSAAMHGCPSQECCTACSNQMRFPPTPSTPKDRTAPSTHRMQQHPLVALVVQDLACLLQQRLLLHVVDWHPALNPPHGRERPPLAVQHVCAVGTAAAVYAGSAHRAVSTQGRPAEALCSKRRVACVAVAPHGLPRCQAVVSCGWARAGQASRTVAVSL